MVKCFRTLVLASTLVLMPLAYAQSFPNKPIRIIYPFAAGGTGDALTRVLAESMKDILNQAVILENRLGANGAIGVRAVATSPNDGYTVLLSPLTTTVSAPLITNDPGLAPEKALAPVANVSVAPLLLFAHNSVPANDFPSFIDWARKQPGGVDFGTTGATMEVVNALLARDAMIQIVNVNYRGNAPSMQALLGGEVKVLMSTPTAALAEYVRQGKIKLLGVTSEEPTSLAPGAVPIQRFLPGFVQDIHYALWVPHGTPAEAMMKLQEAVGKSLAKPGMARKFEEMGTSVKFASPDEVARITAPKHKTSIRPLRNSMSSSAASLAGGLAGRAGNAMRAGMWSFR